MGLRSSDFLAQSRSSRGCSRVAAVLLGLIVLLAALASWAVLTHLPRLVEHHLRTSLLAKGFHQVDLSVRRAAWRELELAQILLSRDGWNASAKDVTLRYQPLAFLQDRYQSIELHELKAEVDLDALLRSRTTPFPRSLRVFHQANRYDLIRFHQSRFLLRRGDASENLEVTGDLRTQGPLHLAVTGEGISSFSLSLDGDVDGSRGDAKLRASLLSPGLLPLLQNLAPDWLQKNPAYAVGKVEITTDLRLSGDQPRVLEATGVLDWAGWHFPGGQISPARVHAVMVGNTAVLKPDPLILSRNDGLTAQGLLEVTLTPPAAGADEPFLHGVLQVESWTGPEISLAPFAIPFSGSPAQLRFGPANIRHQDKSHPSLHELWIFLENAPGQTLHAGGNALLEVPLPSLLAAPASTLRLPSTGQFQGQPGQRTLDFSVLLQDPLGQPLEFALERFLIRLQATLSGSLTPQSNPDGKIPFRLDFPRLDIVAPPDPILSIHSLALTGSSNHGLITASGGGLWEGASFPVVVSQTIASSSAPEEKITSLALGPIPLRDASWPGNLIKPWRGTRSQGELLLTGTLHQPLPHGSPPRPDLTILLRDGRLDYPDQITSASGVQATARIVSLSPLTFAPDISIAVDQFSTGKVDLTQIRLSFTLHPDGGLRVNSFQANLLGGSIRIAAPVLISPGHDSFQVAFELSRIQGQEIVLLFPKFKGRIEASLSGRIPLAVEDGRLRFLPGHLSLDDSTPARLSYDATGFLTGGSSTGRQRSPKFSQSVERALGNLTIQSLDVRLFDPSTPSHPALIKLSGLGIDERLNLPVNLTIPVEDEEGIITSLFARILSGGMHLSVQPSPQ